jgi:hypothetical protein
LFQNGGSFRQLAVSIAASPFPASVTRNPGLRSFDLAQSSLFR